MYIPGGYDPSNSHHHELMCSLIMTCSDISDTCKEWETAKSIAVSLAFCFNSYVHTLYVHYFWQEMIYREFFAQGDLVIQL